MSEIKLKAGYKIRNPEGMYFITFSVVEWVDVFTRKEYADIIIESLKYCVCNKGLRVHAWCLMSNHIHLIASSEEGSNLSNVLRDFKKFTSSSVIRSISENKIESRRNWMLWLFKSAGERNCRNEKYQFWRQNNQPKELETNHFMDEKLNYLHENPVKVGMVESPEDYLYSSARDYSGLQGLVPIELIE